MVCLGLSLTCFTRAGVTEYVFTSASWASRVGAEVCDGVSDGWHCDQAATDYSAGYTDAQGRRYSQGVSVKTGSSGAGATSVRSFTHVRQMTLRFCQNSSKGKGVFYYQVGANPYDSLIIRKPAVSGTGVYLRDSVLTLSVPQTGTIRFWVRCTENAINIHSLTIRAEEGGSTPFTTATYRLVTDVAQLQDSDQIIIGVHQPGVPYVMGYYDESVSQNNIHAIRAAYSPDRTTVAADDDAIYTLRRTTLDGETCWYIQDELRYEEAYLVANGGRTKNKLSLWTTLTDSKTYGNYGYWDIQVSADGEAVLMNRGNSLGRYLQYNAQNSPTLFGCYASQGAQTPVALYRRTEALGDTTAIVAPLVNFGTVVTNGSESLSGCRDMEVNANRLTADIEVSLKHGAPFSLTVQHLLATSLDRDGDVLTVCYEASAPGHYVDTLLFRSGEVVEQVAVMLTVVQPMTVAEAVHRPDYTQTYLGEVEVTRKYDMYIFVRDETGSMLIWDGGNGATGKRYGAGLKNGDRLQGVCGRMRNYYGVPELAPTQAWTVVTGGTAEPEETLLPIDSADVCRYIRLQDVVVENESVGGLAVSDPFAVQGGVVENRTCTLDAIVMISWDALQLWVVQQHVLPTGIDYTPSSDQDSATSTQPQVRKVLRDGELLLLHDGHTYHITGQ